MRWRCAAAVGRLDDRAQALAVSRVERGRSADQDIETGAGRFEPGDPGVHIREALVDQAANVQAGRIVLAGTPARTTTSPILIA